MRPDCDRREANGLGESSDRPPQWPRHKAFVEISRPGK